MKKGAAESEHGSVHGGSDFDMMLYVVFKNNNKSMLELLRRLLMTLLEIYTEYIRAKTQMNKAHLLGTSNVPLPIYHFTATKSFFDLHIFESTT
jgi:hypothetical protein